MDVRKKRPSTATIEAAGVLAVATACNNNNLIWRELFQQDVGVDGTVEVCLDEFPTGKIVGAQVKSGMSYVKGDSPEQFKFYAREVDVEYWLQLSIHLFLFVYHPDDDEVYWHHVTNDLPEDHGQLTRSTTFTISKSNKINADFAAYLRTLFSLEVYDSDRMAELTREMASTSITVGHGDAAVTVSALDLFVQGLWGLCSKLQFHASILLQRIRKNVTDRGRHTPIAYTFSRSHLYPFLIRYFRLLSTHGLAKIDIDDINESLYRKMEQPTFIAPLTTNGRAFVKYLRENGNSDAHDNQFFTLSLSPSVQIEIYESFVQELGMDGFGPFTDVFSIKFNQYLDYYEIQHFTRTDDSGIPKVRASQIMYFHEITEYLSRTMSGINRDRVVLRYLDNPCTPLIAWLEARSEDENPFHISDISTKTNSEQIGFHDEVISMFSGIGAMTVQEPPLPEMPIRSLINGENLS